jgi:hypothetical protein
MATTDLKGKNGRGGRNRPRARRDRTPDGCRRRWGVHTVVMATSSNIALSTDELRALCWALDNYLPGLRYEEARVKRQRDRHDLVVNEELLTALRDRLGKQLAGLSAEATSAPSRGRRPPDNPELEAEVARERMAAAPEAPRRAEALANSPENAAEEALEALHEAEGPTARSVRIANPEEEAEDAERLLAGGRAATPELDERDRRE